VLSPSQISLAQDSLLLEVFDEHRLTRDNFLGKLHFKLQQIPIEMKKVDISAHGSAATYPLKPRSTKSKVAGTLRLKFLYYNDPPPRGSPGMGTHNLAQLVVGATGTVNPQHYPSREAVPSMVGGGRNGPHDGAAQGINRQESGDWVMVDPEDVEPLPRGWEERRDANGRLFYVDHVTRRTQWERPTQANVGPSAAQLESDRRRQMAMTLARRNPAFDSTLTLTHSQSSTSIQQQRSESPSGPRSNNSPRSFSQSQIVSPSAMQANGDDELPPGWEKRLASNGRWFYIDHNTKKTQWEPPRRHARPVSFVASPASGNRQSLSDQELGPLPPGWEMRLQPDGKRFFIDHTTRSTQWEDPRLLKLQKQAAAAVPYSRDYKAKYESFRKQLLARKPENLPRVLEIPVRRSNLFEDSHRAIMSVKNKDHMKTRLWVKFQGEVGLDYGGVSREWFFLLSHEMFNPYYGLFEYAASDNYTLQVNPDSGFCNENHLEYFRFIGRILALAVYHQRLIDAFFIRPFYKMLLAKKITLGDMEVVDTEFYNSIKYILENDPEPLCLTFSASREFLGQLEDVELKPNGADIDVTERNKKEYVDLLMKWRFEHRINKQMEAIKKGFNDVFPLRMLQIFDERELEYLLCGLAEINVDDWRRYTVYANGYTATDDVIVWFWKAVENFDSELRARLLQFVTGTSKVPMNGFAELQGKL